MGQTSFPLGSFLGASEVWPWQRDPHPHGHVGDGRLLSTITAEAICAGEAAAQKVLRDLHI